MTVRDNMRTDSGCTGTVPADSAWPIAISRLHFPVTRLGPGRRIGIWLQGCSIRCRGCISMDTWAPERGVTTVAEVAAALAPWLPAAEGITVSGGEPFDQPQALAALLGALRRDADLDVLVFTGYRREAIAAELAAMDGLVDALIDGAFDAAAPQTLALRGSDNQRLHALTARGRRRFSGFERALRPADRGVDLMLDADGSVWLAGIPARADLARLEAALKGAGHAVTTTADRRGADARLTAGGR